ncbi:MAG: YitT family protein [Oribacterium sp.]|nr:YitT family protein [Oribacterium sp.]
MVYSKRTPLRDYIFLTIGAVLVSIASQNIYAPAGLVTGGVGGISIMLKRLFGLPLWLSNTIINIPLFIIGYFACGWKFIRRTLYATAVMSVALLLLPEYNLVQDNDLFLQAIFGGIFCGAGSGLVFAALATTGGTDLLAAIIQKKMRHLSIPTITEVLDWSIVIVGIGIFGGVKALYAVISIYVFSQVSNWILDGLHFAKCAYIISERSKEIADRILTEMDRGVTGIQAKGMYSGNDTEMLYCVISKRETAMLHDIVHAVDPEAFVIVSDVREVHGEGFTR